LIYIKGRSDSELGHRQSQLRTLRVKYGQRPTNNRNKPRNENFLCAGAAVRSARLTGSRSLTRAGAIGRPRSGAQNLSTVVQEMRRQRADTLARTVTRTEADFDFKLCLWRFTFLNRTKPTKYETLEKNAVSRPIVPKIGNLRYGRDPRKPHFCSGIFGLFVDAEARTLGRVAEGEELGSNLLHTAQRER
jgi:hypothetical protein